MTQPLTHFLSKSHPFYPLYPPLQHVGFLAAPQEWWQPSTVRFKCVLLACMYENVCVCEYVRMHTRMHSHVCVCLCTHAYAVSCVCVFAGMWESEDNRGGWSSPAFMFLPCCILHCTPKNLRLSNPQAFSQFSCLHLHLTGCFQGFQGWISGS